MPKMNLNKSHENQSSETSSKEVPASEGGAFTEGAQHETEQKERAGEEIKAKIEAIEIEKPKNKGGRPKGSKTKNRTAAKPDEASAIEELDFTLIGAFVLDLALARMPNPIPASADEKKLFSDSLSKVAKKYAPSLGNYDAEFSLALAAAVIFLPRLTKPQASEAGASVNGEDLRV